MGTFPAEIVPDGGMRRSHCNGVATKNQAKESKQYAAPWSAVRETCFVRVFISYPMIGVIFPLHFSAENPKRTRKEKKNF